MALNGQPQRATVVVVGDQAEPLLLAECKAPGIPVGRQTLAQAVRYNSVLGARYIILTNGLRHYCCECRDGEYVQLDGFPDLSGEPLPSIARKPAQRFLKFLSIYPWKASL